MNHVMKKKLTVAIGASLTSVALSAGAAEPVNPFVAMELPSGYLQLAEGTCGEGKCGGQKSETEGKCGEGKCGGQKSEAEGKCGEGKCGGEKSDAEGKCGEGKCGGKKSEAEGKCGEGKCGHG